MGIYAVSRKGVALIALKKWYAGPNALMLEMDGKQTTQPPHARFHRCQDY